MFKHKYILAELIKIEITQNYKKSFLGVAWLFLLPLFQSGIWLFLKWNGLIHTGDIQTNYVAFILLSTSLWQLYNYTYDYIGNSITTSIKSLTQANIPLWTIIMARFAMTLFRFFISLIINVVIILIFITTDINLFGFLLLLIPYFIFCFGVGILTSMLEVISDDIYILGKEFNKLLYFITPIFYFNIDSDSLIGQLNKYNPLTYLISIPRSYFFNLELIDKDTYLLISVSCMVVFAVIFIIYIKRARKLIEKIID